MWDVTDHSLMLLYWLLTWTADNKDEERQEPWSHRNFIITDISLRDITFKSVANARISSHLIVVVQWDLAIKVYIHCSIKNHYFIAKLVIPYINSLIRRLTLKSVKLIHDMKLISLLLLQYIEHHEELCYRGFDVSSLGDVFAVFLVGHTNPLFGDHRYKCWWFVKVSWRRSQTLRAQTIEDEERTTSIFVYVHRM